jgi:hypothetical protein
MSTLSRDEVIAAVGPVSDATAAEIIGTGITQSELAKACAWVAEDAAVNDATRLPTGRIGAVIGILERIKENKVIRSPLGEGGSTLE